jgi:hypothetical protein
VKRITLCSLLGGILISSSGCGLLQAVLCYRPCAMRGDSGPAMACGECEGDCGTTCGTVRRPIRGPASIPARAQVVADYGAPCDTPCARPCRRPLCRNYGPGSLGGDPSADLCGSGSSGRCWHRGPLNCVFALLMPVSWWGPSCGERYWGDFYSDPPDCWDPCDGYGNYTGNTGNTGNTGGGCRNCGDAHGAATGYSRNYAGDSRVDESMSVPEGKIISQSDRAVGPAPSPASQPHKATRP